MMTAALFSPWSHWRVAISHALRTIGLVSFAALLPHSAVADIVPPKVEASTPSGINIADSSFSYHVTDLTIGTLSLERFILPKLPSTELPVDDAFFSRGMTSNFDMFVSPTFIHPTGPPWNIPGEYHTSVHLGASASGLYGQAGLTGAPYELNLDSRAGILTVASGTYTYSDKDGAVYVFNAAVGAGGGSSHSQRIASITSPDGRVRTFTYDAYNHLRMVADSTGYAIILVWTGNASTDAIAAACGFDLSYDYVTASSTCSSATLKVAYTYTSGSLTGFTDVFGQVTTYTGVFEGYLGCLKPPGYAVCKVSYGGTLLADGETWTVYATAADNINDPETVASCASTSTVTDPAGKVSNWAFCNSSPTSHTDADGNTTTYQFTGAVIEEPWAPPTLDNGSMLVHAVLPEGNEYLAEYTGPFNSLAKQTVKPKPVSVLPNQVTTTTYATGLCAPRGCAKVSSQTDPNGNTTNYTYASWGGIQSEMQAAPTTGAARPLKLYDYVQKYAYVKNAGGTLVASSTPVWVPNSETDCQTVAGSSTPTCDSGAPQVVITYEYAASGTADNLLPRGKVVASGGVSMRTCYGYDTRSNEISETSARAGLTVCP